MNYINNLMEEFFQFSNNEDIGGADLLLYLSDGNQAILANPNIEGDTIRGRWVMFSTGQSSKHDCVPIQAVVRGTPISLDASLAKMDDWKEASKIRMKEICLQYLARNDIPEKVAKAAIRHLAQASDPEKFDEVRDHFNLKRGKTKLKLSEEEISDIVKGLRIRMSQYY